MYTHVQTSTTASVDHGSSMVTHGVATLGPLSITCSGEINEQLWGAGSVLAAYFFNGKAPDVLEARPEVAELGAGCGLAGMTTAICGASTVTLTDLPKGVSFLENVINDNQAAFPEDVEVTAAAVTWGDRGDVDEVFPCGVDLIIGSDLLYNPNTFPALLETIVLIARKREGTRILIATELRWDSVNEEWERAIASSELEKVKETELETPESLPRTVRLLELKLKKEREPAALPSTPPPPPAWLTTMFSPTSKRSHPSLGLSYLQASLPVRTLPLPCPLPYLQQLDSSQDLSKSLGVGTVIWDVAVTLTHFLTHHYELLEGKKVLDLGTGVGQLAIATAMLGSREVVASDVEDLRSLVEKNVHLAAMHLHGMSKKRVLAVDYVPYLWGVLPVPASLLAADVVILSDCLYDTNAFDALMPTLGKVVGDDTLVLIAYHRRIDEREIVMFERLGEVLELTVMEWPCEYEDSYLLVGEKKAKRGGGGGEGVQLRFRFSGGDMSSVLDKDDSRWSGDSLSVPLLDSFLVRFPAGKVTLVTSKWEASSVTIESVAGVWVVKCGRVSVEFVLPSKGRVLAHCWMTGEGVERVVEVGFTEGRTSYTKVCEFAVDGLRGVRCVGEDDCYVILGEDNCKEQMSAFGGRISDEEEARLFREAVESWRVERPDAVVVDTNMNDPF